MSEVAVSFTAGLVAGGVVVALVALWFVSKAVMKFLKSFWDAF